MKIINYQVENTGTKKWSLSIWTKLEAEFAVVTSQGRARSAQLQVTHFATELTSATVYERLWRYWVD
jgi:hypothetical protein